MKNVTKRLERPSVLTPEEFHKVLPHIRPPYRAMVWGRLGLRASEIVGLQWRDFDFEKSTLLVQRGVIHGRVDDVKTEYSRDVVPIAPELATDRPYHQEEIQKKHIRVAAKAVGITFPVGWKTFRHSYRTWLDETDAPIGVQSELMRHASIQTTMNVYGRAMTDSKRQAHNNVVRMVLQASGKRP